MHSQNLPCLLLFGPSRAGKSSFINTLARKSLATVGGSRNESTTSSVISHNITVQTQNNKKFLDLLLIDTPGSNDSKLRISNTEITARIEEKLLSLTTQDSLSCILVFESLASEPTQLRSTLCALEGLLGSNFKQSVIVVLTKADSVMDEEELEGAKKTAEGICKGFGMPSIYWTNNHHQLTVDEQVFMRQVGELKNKIGSVSMFSLQGVKDYRKKIQERARTLELTTPKRKKIEQFEVISADFEPYTVQLTKYREEVRFYQRSCGGLAGLFGFTEIAREDKTVPYTEKKTRYRKIEIREIHSKEVQIPYGPDHFINIAKDQILKELRDKYRQM